MPYKSEAQRRYFNWQAGKAIPASTVNEFNKASKGKDLPEKIKKRKKNSLKDYFEA